VLHGHPTRSRAFNRVLGIASLAVWYPYDIYRASHLAHHRDEALTQPGIDPESNYISAGDYARLRRWCRPLWVAQRTVVGRVLLGPALVIVPLWLDIVRRPLRGDFSQNNGRRSHSLCYALRALVTPLAQDGRFFARTVRSGSHRESLAPAEVRAGPSGRH
jgi:hypothetical protein